MVILVCIVEMHTLNLLMCEYHLGTTLNISIFWRMFLQLLRVFSLPRLNTPNRLCTHRFRDFLCTSVAQKKSAYLSWGVKCELKVSTSLSTPLHSSQIIDLQPPKKDCIVAINCLCGNVAMCLIVKYVHSLLYLYLTNIPV